MSWLVLAMLLLARFGILLGDQFWSKFASDSHYQNYKLLSRDPNNILIHYYSSVSVSILWTKMACARECVGIPGCQAFNFYSNETHHTCELLADNFCLNSTGSLSLQAQSSGFIFDKLNEGRNGSCFSQYFANVAANQSCEEFRPDCVATWPDCNDCVRSCIDCQRRYNLIEDYQCKIWPEGPSTEPILVSCYNDHTYLMKRSVDIPNAYNVYEYRMSFADMNRLIRINVYTQLQFLFAASWDPSEVYQAGYKNPYIDSDGTLSNLTFIYSNPDGLDHLQLNNGPLAATPFKTITIANDSCGSFWQLNPNNAPTCPGGKIGLFGAVQRDSRDTVINTGIQWPPAAGRLLIHGDISLIP